MDNMQNPLEEFREDYGKDVDEFRRRWTQMFGKEPSLLVQSQFQALEHRIVADHRGFDDDLDDDECFCDDCNCECCERTRERQ